MNPTVYLNRDPRPGEVFGVFADRDAAARALRQALRSTSTHTIVRTQIGYVVTWRPS